MIGRLILFCALLAVALPAAAERRGYTVTSFNRIVVNGPFIVRVSTADGSQAYAEGDTRAIDEISVQVTGQTLTVRRNVSGSWGGFPGEREAGRAVLHLSTHELERVSVIGTGDVEIDRMESRQVMASLGGNGRLAVGEIEADNIMMAVTGAGVFEAGGHAETGRLNVEGPATVDAGGLVVENLRVHSNGPGVIEIGAEREADVTVTGTGTVVIVGDAACTDRSVGSSRVICGGFLTDR